MRERKFPGDLFEAISGCPPVEELVSGLDGSGCLESDSRLVQHVESCPHCQAELALFRSYEEAEPGAVEQADLEWVLDRVPSPEEVREIPDAVSSGGRPSHSLLSWLKSIFGSRPLGALAAVAAVVILVIGLRGLGPSAPELQLPPADASGSVLRGGELRLESPGGELDVLPSTLSWRMVEGAANYTVVFATVDGSVLERVKTADHSIVWPAAARDLFQAGRPLFVQISALDGAGSKVAESERLRIVRKAGGDE